MCPGAGGRAAAFEEAACAWTPAVVPSGEDSYCGKALRHLPVLGVPKAYGSLPPQTILRGLFFIRKSAKHLYAREIITVSNAAANTGVPRPPPESKDQYVYFLRIGAFFTLQFIPHTDVLLHTLLS